METPAHLSESWSYLINCCGLQITENCLLLFILNSNVPFLGNESSHCNDILKSYFTIWKGIKYSIVYNSQHCLKISLCFLKLFDLDDEH